MKRFLKYIVVAIIIVSSAFFVYQITSEYRVSVLSDGLECNIVLKGVEGARGITTSETGYYIAFENAIVEINNDGKERVVIKDKSLNIEDIEVAKDEIYFLSKSSLYKLNIGDGTYEEVVKNIPSEGERLNRKLLGKGEDLYISISSVTNSGVASVEDGVYDKAPYDITLGEGTKGKVAAYKPYGEEAKPGDVIKGNNIGNASVYMYDVNSKKIKLVGTGIKNVTGFDYDSKNVIYMTVEGMKAQGERPIYRDKDYIYRFYNGIDIGFPDYSGGDPITSPRFMKEIQIKNLLQNSLGKNVPSPIYQHTSVGTISSLAIDRDGLILEKDSKVFCDKEEGVITSINSKGVQRKILKLNENSNITDIKYVGNKFLVLDSGVGSLYEVKAASGFLGFNLSPVAWIVIISILIILLIVIVLKVLKRRK